MNDTNNNWKFYKGAGEKYRWSRQSDNGNTIGASTQGYTSQENCKNNAIVNCFPEDKKSNIKWDDTYRKY